ncbi:MAG: phosphotransferase family protein [Planctomycetaceae bacterium]
MTISIDQPRVIRKGEELDTAALENYLLAELPGASGPLSVEQFPSGFSNLTYLIRLGDQELVLRRPPFGNQVKSAHDMSREYRVLSRLCEVYPPAPRPLVFCQDHNVIGDDFYVMERRKGVILRQSNAPSELTNNPDLVHRLCESFIDNLADLHLLDYTAAGLGDLGKPVGYVERQVTGWARRYEKARTDHYADVERLSTWLVENLPGDGGAVLVHNDYKYDNLVLDPNDLTRIDAVLDWEMATIGDPLSDLGTTLAYWTEASDPPLSRMINFGPTTIPGSFTRRELVDRYADRTGLDVSNIQYFYVFGLFKLAVILQQIYARYHHGHTQDERFAHLNETVASLGTRGMDVVNSGTL